MLVMVLWSILPLSPQTTEYEYAIKVLSKRKERMKRVVDGRPHATMPLCH